MPNRVPKSYDEITRATVPNPDSSWRPTVEQERQAYEGFRAMDADEQALHGRVERALAASGHDVERVTIEVAGDKVMLEGTVSDSRALMRILDSARAVQGVGEVVDRLVIEAD